MKNIFSTTLAIAIAVPVIFCSCHKILDKEPLNALDESKVWASASAATALLDTV